MSKLKYFNYICGSMRKLSSILLLFVMGIILFPLQIICVAHPFGHKHHEHDKPSPCELRKQYNGKKSALFPPMHCNYFSSDTDNYQTTEKFQIKPTYQTLALGAVLFKIVKIDYPEQPFIIPPEPNCRSATILLVHSLRAPPFC